VAPSARTLGLRRRRLTLGTKPATINGEMPQTEEDRLPPTLVIAAAIAWRVLVVAAALALAALVVVELRLVMIPAIGALFAAAVLVHPVGWLRRRGVPPAPAAALVEVGAIAVIVVVGVLLAPSVGREFRDLGPVLQTGVQDVQRWLADGPLQISEPQVRMVTERITSWARDNATSLATGAVRGAALAVELVAGIFLFAFLTFFFVKDGERITAWFLDQVDTRHRDLVRALARRTWGVLGAYLRGTTIVALVDSTLIGIGLLLVGVPLVAPLMLLVFAGAYFPIVGATVAGAVASLVALVTGGLTDALLIVGVVIGVQQVEGHVLAPVVLGRAVRLHPAVVLMALTGGAVLGGIVGAFLAVPVTAALAAAGNELRLRRSQDARTASPEDPLAQPHS